MFREVGSTVEKDLTRAEAIAVPLTMILLLRWLTPELRLSNNIPQAIPARNTTSTLIASVSICSLSRCK